MSWNMWFPVCLMCSVHQVWPLYYTTSAKQFYITCVYCDVPLDAYNMHCLRTPQAFTDRQNQALDYCIWSSYQREIRYQYEPILYIWANIGVVLLDIPIMNHWDDATRVETLGGRHWSCKIGFQSRNSRWEPLLAAIHVDAGLFRKF